MNLIMKKSVLVSLFVGLFVSLTSCQKDDTSSLEQGSSSTSTLIVTIPQGIETKAAADYGTYIEINAKKTHLRDEELADIAAKTSARFVIGSDAHSPARVGEISLAEELIRQIRLMKEMGLWLEVTTLVIPGLNDSDEELREIAAFIRDNLGASTPWHVSAFFPCYQMQDRPRTPPSTIHRACETGRAEGLHYVYGGNVANREDEATYCPNCHALCMERSGFRVLVPCKGTCPSCGTDLAGVWS